MAVNIKSAIRDGLLLAGAIISVIGIYFIVFVDAVPTILSALEVIGLFGFCMFKLTR